MNAVDASAEVKKVMLQAKKFRGYDVDDAICDQLFSRWTRKKEQRVKKNIVYWNSWNNQLQLFYRRRLMASGISRMEVFVLKGWRDMEKVFVPFYWTPSLSTTTKQHIMESADWYPAFHENYMKHVLLPL